MADSLTCMTKAEIAKNPLSAFLAKATNTKLQGQRLRGLTAAQMWSKEGFSGIREEVNEEVEEQSINAKRGRVAKAQDRTIAAFKALPADERKIWERHAKEDQQEVARMKSDASAPLEHLDPAETQKYVSSSHVCSQ